MGKIRRYTCSAKNCKSIYSHAEGGVQMLTFPKDQNRCRVWVQNSGNTDLLNKSRNKLYKLRFLCKAHFADDQFLNKYRTRLSKMAIPTIFSEPPLTDEQMEHFEVVDEEVSLPPDQVFRSLTRHIDIPMTTPLSHVVIEVSDLPGRMSCVQRTNVAAPAVASLSETQLACEATAPPVAMDHTYATCGSSGDAGECGDVPLQASAEVEALPADGSDAVPLQCGAEETATLREPSGCGAGTAPANGQLHEKLLEMEKKVRDLQEEVDRLRAASRNQSVDAQQPKSALQPDFIHLINLDVHSGRRKGDGEQCELDEELIALAIFKC